jgi:hypothetical protein
MQMVQENEYQKKLAAERTRLGEENRLKQTQYEQALNNQPSPDLNMEPTQPPPEKSMSDQDVKWQAWVNMEKERRQQHEQEDQRKAQLTQDQLRQEEERERQMRDYEARFEAQQKLNIAQEKSRGIER